MPESIENIIKENLENYADYDENTSRWQFYYDDLHELFDKVLNEFEERFLERKLIYNRKEDNK